MVVGVGVGEGGGIVGNDPEARHGHLRAKDCWVPCLRDLTGYTCWLRWLDKLAQAECREWNNLK
jgi:hypothetical protein